MAKPKTIESKELKNFLNTTKRETRLMGAVERYILARPRDHRNHTVLHPSDMIKAEWCSLASYHALRGNYVEVREKPGLRMQSIFDEGHAIHHKWQNYLKEMGVLHGLWEFTGEVEEGAGPIKLMGWATAPAGFEKITYKEVPLQSEKHKISGHADGWVKGLGEDFLIEIKSIGTGTIRMEAPAILAQADNDLEKAWRNIKQPFRPHILQGQVYLHLCHLMVEEGLLESAPKEIVFIYELKANQDYKEFVVQYTPEFVEGLFERALDISWAVDNERPPMCNLDPIKGCERCAPYREGEDVSK